jgi:hypothetical protein
MTPTQLAALDNQQLDRLVINADINRQGRLKLEFIDGFLNDTAAKNWIIKGLIACGETTAWVGPPGSLKSALLAELAMCVSAQLDFHGLRAKRRAGVLYFALERADLVRRRLRAYHARLGTKADLPLAVIAGMLDLTNTSVVGDVLDAIKRFEKRFDCPPEVLIFDTFAKLIAAGGGDEDKARDQGRVFANVQRIKDATGAHVALVGHTGKDETRGARGSNAILGDVDVMVTISGDEVKTATVAKANDMAEGPLFSFKSEAHDFGVDDDGDPITVNIVSADQVEAVAVERGPKLTPDMQTMLDILLSAGQRGLTTEDWNEQAKDAGIGLKRPAKLYDLKHALQKKGMVRQFGSRPRPCPVG